MPPPHPPHLSPPSSQQTCDANDTHSLFLHDPKTGTAYPTAGFTPWHAVYVIQRSPVLWGSSALLFDPSRFLPSNASTLPANAWAPFERGPRNCIGQELAIIETKIILALTVRLIDTETVFGRLGEVAGDGSAWARDEGYRRGRQDLGGEEAYQVLLATAKPREGLPMVVRLAGVE